MPTKFSLKTILTFIFLLFMLISTPLAIFLVRERQEIRKKAAVPGGQATVSLSPASGTYNLGETFTESVYFNTANIPISSIGVRITYPFSGTTPELEASNIQINPNLLTAGDWSCPVRLIYSENGRVKIDIACINLSINGFSTSTDTLLATFNLVAHQIPAINPTVLEFDPNESVIQGKSDNQDILLIPTSTGTYTISGGVTPTPTSVLTPTPTPTPTPPTPTPTVSPSPTPTSGLTPTPTPTPTLISTPTPTSTPTIEPDCGDVNCSGEVNMGDVTLLQGYVGNPGQYTICSQWAADVNCSGEVNMGDVSLLHSYVGYPGDYQLNCCPSIPTPTPTPTPTQTQECPLFDKGDATCDNKVNELDYVIWWDSYRKGDLRGDFDGDGKTNDLDYVIWWSNYGTTLD